MKESKSKLLMASLLEKMIGREVKIPLKMKHSPNYLEMYQGMDGIVKSYELGEPEDSIIVLVELTMVSGKRQVQKVESVWLDARDLV